VPLTPAELLANITALPADHPARVAFEGGSDTGCETELNAKTLRGPVPLEELSSYCVTRGITGMVQVLDEIPVGEDIAPGVPMTAQVKGLLKTVLTIVQTDWRLSTADMDDPAAAGMFAGLAALGVITVQQQGEISALADSRRSLADGWAGGPITHLDVANARKEQ